MQSVLDLDSDPSARPKLLKFVIKEVTSLSGRDVLISVLSLIFPLLICTKGAGVHFLLKNASSVFSSITN